MFCSSYSFFFFFLLLCSVAQSCPTLWLRGQQHTKLLCPWNFPCKNTGVGCYFILQRIFPTQISDLCLLCFLHWQVVSLPLVPPFSSVQFSRTIMSNSLWPHELQHTRPPHPSPTPGVHSDLRPSSQWCHPTISSFVLPFSSCLQFFPASESFPVSQLFASGSQRIRASASASVLPVIIEGWLPLGLTGLISLLSKGLSTSSPAPQFESINSSVLSLLYGPVHICTCLLEKP